jgi:hypothetical protein
MTLSRRKQAKERAPAAEREIFYASRLFGSAPALGADCGFSFANAFPKSDGKTLSFANDVLIELGPTDKRIDLGRYPKWS